MNMLKQASAFLTLLKEAADLETPNRSSLVLLIKKGCIKRVMVRRLESKRRIRTVMRLNHIWFMIKKLYSKPACKVAPSDRRFLVQQLFLYFGMRRFYNIKEVMVKDVKLLENGDLEVYIRRSKTDQEERGSVFHMSGAKLGGFSIPRVLCWYIGSMGLKRMDYLFPRFRGT